MNVLDNGVQASAVKLLEFQLCLALCTDFLWQEFHGFVSTGKYFAESVKTRKNKCIKVKFK